MALPEVHVVCGSFVAATRLGSVAQAMRMAGLIAPVLIAAGNAPSAVSAVFTELHLITDLTLPPGPVGGLIARFDRMWTHRRPGAVLVAGADPAGAVAALAAAWRGIPVAHLDAGIRPDKSPADSPASAEPSHEPGKVDPETNARMIAQVANLHLVARPVDAMNLIDEGTPALDVLISGDDTLAPRRAAQAVAALTGLAQRPAPMPVAVPPPTARFRS